MAFKLEKRRYGTIDLFRIPFQCAPVSSIMLCVQKLITTFSNVFQVVSTAKLVDNVIVYVKSGEQLNNAVFWLVITLLFAGWKRIAFNVGQVFNQRAAIKANEQISLEFTNKRARLDYALIEDEETGRLIDRISSNIERNVWEMLQRFVSVWLVYIPRIIGIFIIIFTQVWWLAIVVSVRVIPLMLISSKGGKKVYKADIKAAAFERRHKHLFTVLTGREAVDERALFGYSKKISKDWHKQYEQSRKITIKAEAAFEMNMCANSSVASIISSVIVLFMVPSVAGGAITVGMFIALATAVHDLVYMMGWSMSNAVMQVSKSIELMKDYTAFAALPEALGAAEPPLPPLPFHSLEFKNVTFRYPKTEVDILKNFSMKLENDKHYSFVGENGAGKTTVTKLITGLYTEYDGEILLNGKNLNEYSAQQLKGMFAGVYQDFARYYISVRDNILLGDISRMEDEGSCERVRRFAATLDIDDVLSSLPHGYDTKIGKLDDESLDLSGGQWQRIAMTRALMNPAPVQILDEPTAALDPISESRLYEQFEEISRNHTTIFISHRLGSTKLADHIFVLQDGTVTEQGTHSQLITQNGLYAEMYQSQQSWYTEQEVQA